MKTHNFVNSVSPLGFHNIHYTSWNDSGSSRAVVCVHGLTGNANNFNSLARSLEKKHTVHAIDMVGRGESGRLFVPSFYNNAQYIYDSLVVINNLGLEEIDWVGTSMGGIIGMMLASMPHSPIKRLVLNDVGPYISAKALNNLKTKLVEEHKENTSYDPKILSSIGALLCDIDLEYLWKNITCPVLVLHGKDSEILTDKDLKRMRTIRDFDYAGFEGVGHVPLLNTKEQTDVVEKWLKGK